MLWEFDSRSRLFRVVWKIGQGSSHTKFENAIFEHVLKGLVISTMYLCFVDVGRSCIGVYTPVALYHVDEMSVDCCVQHGESCHWTPHAVILLTILHDHLYHIIASAENGCHTVSILQRAVV